MVTELTRAYMHHRRNGTQARTALNLAREDVANGRKRYVDSFGYRNNNPDTPNAWILRNGKRTLRRWIENTESAGLRFVGYSDEINRTIRHKGWYIDPYFEGIYRGAVWRLPARGGVSRFVYGYEDPNNDGAALVDFNFTDDESEAATWADGIAESDAEREREYQEGWQQGMIYFDLGESIRSTRKSALALIREIKASCDGLQSAPTIRATLESRLRAMRADIKNAREKREKMRRQYGAAFLPRPVEPDWDRPFIEGFRETFQG